MILFFPNNMEQRVKTRMRKRKYLLLDQLEPLSSSYGRVSIPQRATKILSSLRRNSHSSCILLHINWCLHQRKRIYLSMKVSCIRKINSYFSCLLGHKWHQEWQMQLGAIRISGMPCSTRGLFSSDTSLTDSIFRFRWDEAF
jgi:hypothetical protein